MKSTLIRVLGIMILASSISAFAQPDSKAKKTNCDNTTSASTTAPDSKASMADSNASKVDSNASKADNTDKNQEKSQRERLIEEQEKQWLHEVQNITGG